MCLGSEKEVHRLPKDYEGGLVMASAVTACVTWPLASSSGGQASLSIRLEKCGK
jgi:hypothetical protein